MAKFHYDWFRVYCEAYRDPKIIRLSDKLHRFWFNVLCLAGESNGILPDVRDIACHLRLRDSETGTRLAELLEMGLVDDTPQGLTPHNWSKRQYKSDVSTERVKRFRNGLRNTDETLHETHETPSEADTETDTESEADTESAESASAPPATIPPPLKIVRKKSKTAFPLESIPAEWVQSALDAYGWNSVKAETVFDAFMNHHKAHGSLMADWIAAWRKWCGNENKFARAPTNGGSLFESHTERAIRIGHERIRETGRL